MIQIAITGATGLLGSNILFEFLKIFNFQKKPFKIYILGRSSKNFSLESRIKKELISSGLDYIFGKKCYKDNVIQQLLDNIVFLHLEMNDNELGLISEDFKKITSTTLDAFIHCAGSTGFANDQETFIEVNKTNVDGIKHLLSLIKKMQVKKFIYISSAYSSGRMSGVVQPDIQYQEPFFPNHYQKSKYDAEFIVRSFVKSNNMQFLIFRPSTIGGRLIEEPYGAVNKYDVFLGFAKAIMKIKSMLKGSWKKIYEDSYSIPFRMHIHPESGLNIVPVDFCAKMIVFATLNISKSQSYNLANHNFILHEKYITSIFDWIKVNGVELVDHKPNNLTEIETIYYNKIGILFDQYITQPPLFFDLQTMHELERDSGVSCPAVDTNSFNIFMEYAVKNNFGYLRPE